MPVVRKTSVSEGRTEPQPCKWIWVCSPMVSTADSRGMDTIALTQNRGLKRKALEDGRTLRGVIALWWGFKAVLSLHFIVFAVLCIFIFYPWSLKRKLVSLLKCCSSISPMSNDLQFKTTFFVLEEPSWFSTTAKNTDRFTLLTCN